MSFSRCEKLMAARIVKTVPSAACGAWGTTGPILISVEATNMIIHSELFGDQFIGAAARGMIVENVDDENFLGFVVAGDGFDRFAHAGGGTGDDPPASRYLIHE